MITRITVDFLRLSLVSVAGLAFVLLTGCGDNAPVKSSPRSSAVTIPIISGDDLISQVAQDTRPMVVEFGVPMGCYRCNDMRPEFDRLARMFSAEISFVRVDFNASAPLASKYGATVCPSYVVFSGGERVACYQYPTSADLLGSELGKLIGPLPSSATESEGWR